MQLNESQKKLVELHAEAKNATVPFEFNKFPILVKGTDIFKVRPDTNAPYVDIRLIVKQLANIRRDGNWPKIMLRVENLEDRIMKSLLDLQDSDSSMYLYDDTFFYMYDPTDSFTDPILDPLRAEGSYGTWGMVCVPNEDHVIS